VAIAIGIEARHQLLQLSSRKNTVIVASCIGQCEKSIPAS
jgi:hypothetical protein